MPKKQKPVQKPTNMPSPLFKLNIDRVSYAKKPDGLEMGAIVNRLKHPDSIVETTLSGVIEAAGSGRTFTCGELTGKSQKDWVSQRLFAVDVDNDAEALPKLSPEEVLKIFENRGIPVTFMYHTFSNTPEHLKFRVVLLCDEVITDREEAKRIIQNFLGLFPSASVRDPRTGRQRTVSQADNACVNLDRMFLGTDKGIIDNTGRAGKTPPLAYTLRRLKTKTSYPYTAAALRAARPRKAGLT